MIQKTQIMIYSTKMDETIQFWLNEVGVQLIETMPLAEGFEAKVLSLNDTSELVYFPKAFIEKYSPEVADNVPSLMFFVDDFEAYYDRISTRGEIFDNGGRRTFNFSTPDGLYFVFAEAVS